MPVVLWPPDDTSWEAEIVSDAESLLEMLATGIRSQLSGMVLVIWLLSLSVILEELRRNSAWPGTFSILACFSVAWLTSINRIALVLSPPQFGPAPSIFPPSIVSFAC